MDRKIKRLTAITMMAVFAIGMMGCGRKGDIKEGDVSNKKTEFKFITAMSDVERSEIIKSVVDKLQEKYPNVVFVNESGEDYNNKAKRAFASGSGYSLVLTDDLGLSALGDAGYLLDLGQYIKERGWDEKQQEGATNFYNQRTPGKQYSVGMNYAPIVVYYNKEIFKELNLKVPKTLDEYEAILKTATDNGYIGAENCNANVNGWYIQSLVQNKAPFEDVLKWYYLEDSKESMKTAFIESSAIVKRWSDAGYFRKDYEGIDYGDIPTLFGQGNTAMSLDGNWFLYDYENTGLDVGVFPFPGVTDSKDSNYIINPVDAAFAIGKHVDDTQLLVALDFIDQMLTPEVAEMWLSKGSIPSLKYENKDAAASPLTQELQAAIGDTKSGFYLDNVRPGFLEIFQKEMQLYLIGDQSAEEMWKRIDEFWKQG
ncbi:ABC transporter substrate-binding protein [Lacrimispora brassicae]